MYCLFFEQEFVLCNLRSKNMLDVSAEGAIFTFYNNVLMSCIPVA
jgi:hypothetical protein